MGGFADVYHVIQRGGRTLKDKTARLLNEFFGVNIPKRDWGRGLEKLKKRQGIGNPDHNDIMNNADLLHRETQELIGNIADYMNEL